MMSITTSPGHLYCRANSDILSAPFLTPGHRSSTLVIAQRALPPRLYENEQTQGPTTSTKQSTNYWLILTMTSNLKTRRLTHTPCSKTRVSRLFLRFNLLAGYIRRPLGPSYSFLGLLLLKVFPYPATRVVNCGQTYLQEMAGILTSSLSDLESTCRAVGLKTSNH